MSEEITESSAMPSGRNALLLLAGAALLATVSMGNIGYSIGAQGVPARVQLKDMNADGKGDIALYNRYGELADVFFRTENDEYKTIDEILAQTSVDTQKQRETLRQTYRVRQ